MSNRIVFKESNMESDIIIPDTYKIEVYNNYIPTELDKKAIKRISGELDLQESIMKNIKPVSSHEKYILTELDKKIIKEISGDN
jgi:hypothetical protein